MKRYLIGIDNGSQSTKVSVFDEHGTVVCEGRQALRPNDTPRPGVVEHPDDDIWFSIGEASRRAMEAFPGDPADIVGVGLCTIRFCRALLKSDGTLGEPRDELDGRSEYRDPTSTATRTCATSRPRPATSRHRMTGRVQGHGRELRRRLADQLGQMGVAARRRGLLEVPDSPRDALRASDARRRARLGHGGGFTPHRASRQGYRSSPPPTTRPSRPSGAGCARPTPCSSRSAPTPPA